MFSEIEHRDCIYLMSRLASFCFFFFLTRFISVQLQIEEISRKLRTGELGIASVEERFDTHKHQTLTIIDRFFHWKRCI